jgi:hypothetical protein
MPTFNLPNGCDPNVLEKQLNAAGFVFSPGGGITYDSGTKTAIIDLDPSETKDPTSIVQAYVYVEYVPPNYPQLYSNASATVQNALTQYNTAVAGYSTALATYNTKVTAYTNAGIPVTSGNAVAHIQPLADALQALAAENAAFALAIPALKDSVAALVSVVTVLAQRTNVVEED